METVDIIIELVQDNVSPAYHTIEDTSATTFPLQCLSIALQKENILFQNTVVIE